jgi:hypothetical protein
VTDEPDEKSKDTHPLWARVLVGLIGGTLLAGFAIMQSGDALGAPLSIGFGIIFLLIPVYAMVRAKKVWSVFRIFDGI